MASWNEMRSFINEEYKVKKDDGETITMVFDLGEGRSQLVLIGLSKNENTGEEWLQISSPIGKVEEVNVRRAAEMTFSYLCGGVVVAGDLVLMHHSAPLANLDTNEFKRPLSVIVNGADDIERQLVGGDKY